jgi:hypothetical protein
MKTNAATKPRNQSEPCKTFKKHWLAGGDLNNNLDGFACFSGFYLQLFVIKNGE